MDDLGVPAFMESPIIYKIAGTYGDLTIFFTKLIDKNDGQQGDVTIVMILWDVLLICVG